MLTVSTQFPLDRGERQLWAGEPRRGLALRASDAFVIPFSLLWAGFAVFWEAGVMKTGAPFFFRLWGIPFLLVGAYMVFGRFWVDAWRRARTTYAVTSDRVIIQSGGGTPRIQSLNIRTLSEVTLEERRDGTGTITFGAVPSLPSMYFGSGSSRIAQSPSFEMIPDARSVYAIIRDAQREPARP